MKKIIIKKPKNIGNIPPHKLPYRKSALEKLTELLKIYQ